MYKIMLTIMLTKVISLKDYRQNITKLWKEAEKENIRYIVLHHSKPIFEVKPCKMDILTFNDETEDYYKTLEQGLEFWKSSEDDDIFKID